MKLSTTIVLAFTFLLLVAALPLAAQRNALGHRLQALEKVWPGHDATEARERALPRIGAAVRAFFTFRLASAAEALDQARFLVLGEELDPARAHAVSLVVGLEKRLVDPQLSGFAVVVEPLYDAGQAPEKLAVTAFLRKLSGESGPTVALEKEGKSWKGLLETWAEEKLGDLDLDLVVVVQEEDRELARFERALAQIPELKSRLDALVKAAEVGDERPKDDWRRATVENIEKDLRAWSSGREPEEEPRMAKMLAQAEGLAASTTTVLAAGESRLTVPVGKRLLRCRIALPESGEETRPLIILIHGAGGSESMFFDALGGGIYVRKGLERGAVVLAPKAPLLGSLDLVGLVDALAEIVAFDKEKVCLVGHSMGAGQALNAARRNPGRFACVAAIAGGSPYRDLEPLLDQPLFLGTGAEDFGRVGVLDLALRLSAMKASHLEVVDLPLTEHLMVVQDLVEPVYEFIDEALSPEE